MYREPSLKDYLTAKDGNTLRQTYIYKKLFIDKALEESVGIHLEQCTRQRSLCGALGTSAPLSIWALFSSLLETVSSLPSLTFCFLCDSGLHRTLVWHGWGALCSILCYLISQGPKVAWLQFFSSRERASKCFFLGQFGPVSCVPVFLTNLSHVDLPTSCGDSSGEGDGLSRHAKATWNVAGSNGRKNAPWEVWILLLCLKHCGDCLRQ